MAVNVPVEFWDKSTWDRYFRDELGAFYAAFQADCREDKKPKKNLKTQHNQTHDPQNLKKG